MNTTAEQCRQYKGLSGLRQLQKDQATKSVGQPKCGWRWKPSNGITDMTSQGAYGVGDLPLYGKVGEPDTIVDGTRWYTDLDKAEKDITASRISKLNNSCAQLAYLPAADAELFGFCKTTNTIIPIQKDAAGRVVARYNTPGYTCDSSQIITAKDVSKCPTPGVQGFYDTPPQPQYRGGGESVRQTQIRDPTREQTQGRSQREGFVSDSCSSTPLSRDCVIQAARFAGCADDATLISALRSGDPTGKQGYDSVLKTRPAYTTFQELSKQELSRGVLRDGSASLGVAIENIGNSFQLDALALKASKDTPEARKWRREKLQKAATDLCYKAGEFDKYDFCQEKTSTTIIDDTFFPCLERAWKEAGGTQTGLGYGGLSKWKGKTFGEFDKYIQTLQTRIVDSADVYSQTAAMRELIGIEIREKNSWRLPRTSSYSRGNEVIVATVPLAANEPNVLLGQVLFFGSEGETVLNVQTSDDQKLLSGGSRSRNVQYLIITDVRPETDKNLQFISVFNDGMLISMNSCPYERVNGAQEFGVWGNSGARAVATRCYGIQKDSAEKPNILVIKHYNVSGPNLSIGYNDCAGAPSGPDPNAKVVLYEHCNYVGRSVALGPGSYPFSKLMATGFPNDALSSLRIPQGYSVQLFQDDIGSRSITLTADAPCLVNNGFNDITSALIITVQASKPAAVNAGVYSGMNMATGIPKGVQYAMTGRRADPWWLENTFFTQEPSAPWLQMEVCTRPDVNGSNRKGLVEKRMVYFNADVMFSSITPSNGVADAPGKKEFVRFVSNSKWNMTSWVQFSGFRTITLLVRPTAQLTVDSEVHVFSHTNAKDQEVKITMKQVAGRAMLVLSVVSAANKKTSMVPITMGEYNLVLLQYIQEPATSSALSGTKGFKSVVDVSLHCFSLSSLASGSAIQNAWKEMIAARNAAPYGRVLFAPVGDGAVGASGCGMICMGRLEPTTTVSKTAMDSFTGDVAWIHGFRVAMEQKEMLEAEARQTWKMYWYRGVN